MSIDSLRGRYYFDQSKRCWIIHHCYVINKHMNQLSINKVTDTLSDIFNNNTPIFNNEFLKLWIL